MKRISVEIKIEKATRDYFEQGFCLFFQTFGILFLNVRSFLRLGTKIFHLPEYKKLFKYGFSLLFELGMLLPRGITSYL